MCVSVLSGSGGRTEADAHACTASDGNALALAGNARGMGSRSCHAQRALRIGRRPRSAVIPTDRVAAEGSLDEAGSRPPRSRLRDVDLKLTHALALCVFGFVGSVRWAGRVLSVACKCEEVGGMLPATFTVGDVCAARVVQILRHAATVLRPVWGMQWGCGMVGRARGRGRTPSLALEARRRRGTRRRARTADSPRVGPSAASHVLRIRHGAMTSRDVAFSCLKASICMIVSVSV